MYFVVGTGGGTENSVGWMDEEGRKGEKGDGCWAVYEESEGNSIDCFMETTNKERKALGGGKHLPRASDRMKREA